jgi:hypothetical protein
LQKFPDSSTQKQKKSLVLGKKKIQHSPKRKKETHMREKRGRVRWEGRSKRTKP